jgi:predicted nucleic-acid-binding protein
LTGLDTNVLLRVFLEDDPSQHRRATAFLVAHRSLPGEPPRLFVPSVVLCELVWVLTSTYRRPKSEILRVLDAILNSRDFEVGDCDAIRAATRRFVDGAGGFADYFISELAIRAGCDAVATFENKLLREKGFIAP